MMDWRSLVVLLAGLVCFGSFAWAVKFHFQSADKSRPGMQIVSIVSLIAFGWFAYALTTEPGGHRVLPFGLCVLSLLLFWWCIVHTRRKRFALAFSHDAPAFLDTDGPYRVARHPFYLSYLLFWTAMALAVPGPLSWAVPAIMAALYTLAAMREETRFTTSVLAREYRTYRRQTGMFLPITIPQRRTE